MCSGKLVGDARTHGRGVGSLGFDPGSETGLLHADGCGGHARLAHQGDFDFGRFDADSANGQLIVDPAQELEYAASTGDDPVTGSVGALAIDRDERRSFVAGFLSVTQIADRKCRAQNPQLASDMGRQWTSTGVHDTGGDAGNRGTDRDNVGAVEVRDAVCGGPHGCLGWPVFVDEIHGWGELAMALQHLGWARLTGNNHRLQPGQRSAVSLQHGAVQRRDAQGVGGRRRLEEPKECIDIVHLVLGWDDQCSALGQRPEDPGDR